MIDNSDFNLMLSKKRLRFLHYFRFTMITQCSHMCIFMRLIPLLTLTCFNICKNIWSSRLSTWN